MSFKKFITVKTSTSTGVTASDFNRLQDNIQDSLQPLVQKIQLDSNIVQGQTLSQGITNNVPHLLNRIPVKFHHTAYAQVDIWFAKAADANFVYLACSADCVIDFEVG